MTKCSKLSSIRKKTPAWASPRALLEREEIIENSINLRTYGLSKVRSNSSEQINKGKSRRNWQTIECWVRTTKKGKTNDCWPNDFYRLVRRLEDRRDGERDYRWSELRHWSDSARWSLNIGFDVACAVTGCVWLRQPKTSVADDRSSHHRTSPVLLSPPARILLSGFDFLGSAKLRKNISTRIRTSISMLAIDRQIYGAFHVHVYCTSKTPRNLWTSPRTPASSCTSRLAASAGVSFGSIPPPGTTHRSRLLEDDTNNT